MTAPVLGRKGQGGSEGPVGRVTAWQAGPGLLHPPRRVWRAGPGLVSLGSSLARSESLSLLCRAPLPVSRPSDSGASEGEVTSSWADRTARGQGGQP